MGGKGSGRPTNEETLARAGNVQVQSPIAKDMFLPNYSGVKNNVVQGKLNADMVDGYHHDQSLLTTATPQFSRLGVGMASSSAIPMVVSRANDGTAFQCHHGANSRFSVVVSNTSPYTTKFITGNASVPMSFGTNQSGTNDSMLFIGTDGKIGIGTTSPAVVLHVAQLPSGTTQFNLDCASDTTTSPATWALRKARGTIASPTNVADGDIMGLIRADAYSNSYLATAQIKFFVDGTVTAGQRPPSRIEFYTNPSNTSPSERMRLDANGDFYFSGSGTGLPYGSFYGNEIAYSTGALTAPQYKQIADTDCEQGELNLVTYTDAGTTLTVSKAGRYLINWSISAESNIANTHVLAGITVNSTTALQNAGRNHMEPGRANAQYGLSGTAILSLAANDVVGVGVGSDVDNITVTVDHVNLSVVHIGG